MTIEEIHQSGARRHGARWLNANEVAAAEVMPFLDNTKLAPILKRLVPLIVLRVLDRIRLIEGYEWRGGEWVRQNTR